MILLSIEDFAAKRRKRQDDDIETLLPLATRWINSLDEDPETAAEASDALIASVSRIYRDTYHDEGGEGEPTGLDKFLGSLSELLDRTTSEANPTNVATLLAVAAQNAATVQAAGDDEEFLLLEWVTMGDKDVRHTHKEVEGEQRPPGETFKVGGEDLPYPGFPKGDPSIWINCRCTLAPVLAAITAAADEGDDMPDEETEETEETLIPEATPWHGVLAPEDEWSGDGRKFAANSLTFRDVPLPLTWQKVSDEGHDGSVVVAKIERISRVDGEMRGEGTFMFSAEADEVVGMIAEFGRFGVSVDADDGEFEIDEESSKITFTSARICSASIVSIPAFSQAFVALGPAPEGFMGEEMVAEVDDEVAAAAKVEAFAPPGKRGPGWITNPADTKRLHDYWTRPGEEGYIKIGWGKGGDFNRCRVLVGEKIAKNSPEDMRFINNICAQWHKDALGYYPGAHNSAETVSMSAEAEKFWIGEREVAPGVNLIASGEKRAPAEWFANPGFTEPTHLTVTEEGRVFGHIAEWTSCHIGFEGVCVSPPRSNTGYAYFANKSVLLDDGETARTGVICLGGKHAPLRMRSMAATQHYDDTTKAIADVAVGEDDYGIWAAGWVRPGTDPDLITALRASDVSGDWREIGGAPEMVAALACNVGGFATPAARVAAGATLSLVAAGMIHKQEDPLDEIADRIISRMEQREAEKRDRAEKVAALRTRFNKDD